VVGTSVRVKASPGLKPALGLVLRLEVGLGLTSNFCVPIMPRFYKS
jgi:hypothetical protein